MAGAGKTCRSFPSSDCTILSIVVVALDGMASRQDGHRPGHGIRAQPRRISTRRSAELPAVLPDELRWTVVADVERGAGDIEPSADEQQTGLLQTDLLLELHRAQGGHRPEVPVKRGEAHVCLRCQILDPEWMRGMIADPADGAADL